MLFLGIVGSVIASEGRVSDLVSGAFKVLLSLRTHQICALQRPLDFLAPFLLGGKGLIQMYFLFCIA